MLSSAHNCLNPHANGACGYLNLKKLKKANNTKQDEKSAEQRFFDRPAAHKSSLEETQMDGVIAGTTQD